MKEQFNAEEKSEHPSCALQTSDAVSDLSIPAFCLFWFGFFFFLAAQLAAFQFPDQGLNPGCSSETPKS